MISADLLHVLGYEEDSYDELTTDRILNDSNYPSLNDLMVECKQWAFDRGFELFSRITSNDHQMKGNCLIIRVESDPETVLTITNEDTEPESVFQACQWILNNKDNK